MINIYLFFCVQHHWALAIVDDDELSVFVLQHNILNKCIYVGTLSRHSSDKLLNNWYSSRETDMI